MPSRVPFVVGGVRPVLGSWVARLSQIFCSLGPGYSALFSQIFTLSNPPAAMHGYLKRCSKYIDQQQPWRSPKRHAGSKGLRTLHDDEDHLVTEKLAKVLGVKSWQSSIEGATSVSPPSNLKPSNCAVKLATAVWVQINLPTAFLVC